MRLSVTQNRSLVSSRCRRSRKYVIVGVVASSPHAGDVHVPRASGRERAAAAGARPCAEPLSLDVVRRRTGAAARRRRDPRAARAPGERWSRRRRRRTGAARRRRCERSTVSSPPPKRPYRSVEVTTSADAVESGRDVRAAAAGDSAPARDAGSRACRGCRGSGSATRQGTRAPAPGQSTTERQSSGRDSGGETPFE